MSDIEVLLPDGSARALTGGSTGKDLAASIGARLAKDAHMNPDDAAQAFEWLGAQTFCAMHWGTFKLTDEPTGEPPARIRAWWKDHDMDPKRLWVFDIGETRALTRA